MQDLNNHSTTNVETSTDDNVGLQIAEYVVAAGAVVGTVASFVTRTAAIAAVPLTASVFLNLLNRRRLDQLTRQRTFADTTEVQRRLTAEIQSLRSQVEGLPASQERSDYNNVKVSITSLSASVSALEQQMMDLQSAGQQQQQPLEAISAMEAEINQLREYHIDLTQSVEALQSQLATDSEVSPVPGNIHQELTTLQNAVAQLSQQTAPVSSAQEPELAPVYNQIEDVKVKMDTMLANISEEMEIARGAMENTQQQVNEVQHQLGVVQQGITHTSTDLPDNLHQQLQATLGPLQDQIGQLENRINSIPTIDSSITQRQEEQLQGLQHHLQDLSNRLETVSAQFSMEIANLPSMVSEQVQHRVSEIREHTAPQVDEAAKQDKFTELDSLLADLS